MWPVAPLWCWGSGSCCSALRSCARSFRSSSWLPARSRTSRSISLSWHLAWRPFQRYLHLTGLVRLLAGLFQLHSTCPCGQSHVLLPPSSLCSMSQNPTPLICGILAWHKAFKTPSCSLDTAAIYHSGTETMHCLRKAGTTTATSKTIWCREQGERRSVLGVARPCSTAAALLR